MAPRPPGVLSLFRPTEQNLGFGSVFTENRGFGFGFKTDPALRNITEY